MSAAGFADVKVADQSIANLTDTYGLVVTHQDLAARAAADAVGGARVGGQLHGTASPPAPPRTSRRS